MTQPTRRSFPRGIWALAIAGLLAVASLGYAIYRSGPSQGAAETAGNPLSGVDTIEAMEARTRENPDDAAAWQKLGLLYFDAGQFADAAKAYESATRLDPEEALLWSSLGEARVMASERDPMPKEALAAFRKAVEIDPKDPRARYFLAVQRDLSGDHEGAIRDWLALLEDTPVDAPWREDLIRTIDQVGKINRIDVAQRLEKAGAKSPEVPDLATRGIPGPSADDLAAASSIPPSQQQDMAQGMVARLEERLKADPSNVEGWIMLMRSRMTLGEPERARKALDDAVAANPGKADLLRKQAGILGVR